MDRVKKSLTGEVTRRNSHSWSTLRVTAYNITYKFVILGVLVVANAMIYQILSGEVSLSTVGTRKCLSIHLNTKIRIKTDYITVHIHS